MIISNLSERVEQTLLNENDVNCWHVIPYEAVDFTGVMLAQGHGRYPKELTINIDVEGCFDIYIGTFSHRDNAALRCRLSDERCFKKLSPPPRPGRFSEPLLTEVFFKTSELSNKKLVIQSAFGTDTWGTSPSALTHIHLIPAQAESPRQADNTAKKMALTNDGFGIFQECPHSRPDDLLEGFENIKDDSCMKILLWGSGTGVMSNFPSKIGQPLLPREFVGQEMWSPFDNIMSYNLTLWEKNNWDSMAVVQEYAETRGWEFHPYVRMEAFRGEFPHDWICSKFFTNHPEYRCLDREGAEIGRMSYAKVEVQDYMLEYFKEILNYNPDGLCLCYVRGVPLVAYEPVMIEGFSAEYGIDPRKLDELDPRWLDYQCKIINNFMKRVKKLMKPGMRLSAIIPGNEIDNRRWGIDPETWVAEGLIDDLYPLGQAFNEEDVHIDCPENLDFKYFNNLPGRENIRLIPMLYPWQMFSEDYKQWRVIIEKYLAEGADAYAVWDAMEASRIKKTTYIGTRLEPADEPPVNYVHLKKINGIRVDRYHYFEVI